MARSTIILGVVAAALLAFILLHERDMLSSKELELRKNRVLTTFVRERVSRVEIVRGGKTIVLERAPNPELEGEFGDWKQTAPMQVAVDQEAMSVLLGELEWLQPRRVIEHINTEDQTRFGFLKPRIEVRYTIGKQRGVLLVGAEEPTGLGLYARGDEPDVAYIVGKDLFEALDHDAGHFHTKELHRGIFLFAASAVVSRTEQGERRAELREGTWWLDAPAKTILSTPDVEGVIKAFDQLRAKRFVAAKLTGPDSYGLATPSLVLTIERKNSGDQSKAASSPVTLRVGAACAGHEGEKYVQVDAGPVMCAADEDLNKLNRPLDELVDRSPLPVDPERLTELRFETPSRVIVLSKQEERWRLRVERRGDGQAQKPTESDADRQAVVEWMKALRALTFTTREPNPGESGRELMTLKLKTSAKAPGLDVQVRVADDGSVWARRTQESGWLRFEPTAAALLTPLSSRFRELELVKEGDVPLARLSVSHAGVTETVERTGEAWRVTAPVVADADPVLLADVTHLLTRLSAVQFVADAKMPEHGLDAAATRVVFSLATNERTAKERTLLLGAATEGGVFAQLSGDAAVFVVPTRVPETLTQGLVAKTILATAQEQITALTLEAGGRTLRIQKEGARLVRVADGKPADSTADTAGVRSLVDRISHLRTQRLVHYGSALPAEGFQRPQIKVVVESTVGTAAVTYELLFGAATGGPEAGPETEVFARRSDLNATLTVPASTVEQLRALVN